MTEKQQHLLQLFRELDTICKENNLRYVMAGGTAIGVVRNEGFIPWDDDVDVYMPRDDWKKLVEISEAVLPENRVLHCVDVDRNYTNTFPRYGSTDSCAVHKHQILGKDSAGEIIDVLTLDPIPADDREYEKYRTHMMIYSELVNMAVVFGARWEIPLIKYLHWLFSYTFLGKDRTLKKLERIMFSYEEADCPRYAMRWGGCPFLFDKDMMFPVKYMDFEGTKAMIPHRMSDYLIWHYGDEWSYIPAHGDRESHDAVTVEGITYKELREDYLPGIRKGKLKRSMILRKIYSLAGAKKAHRLQHKRDLLQAKAVQMDLEARIQEQRKSLKDLVAARDFQALNDIFFKYFQVQLSAAFIGREDFPGIYAFYHPVLIQVGEEAFSAAMLTLVYTERVGKAYRMLVVKENEGGLTPDMEKLKKDIQLFRKAASDYEFRRFQEAEDSVDQLLEQYPQVPGFVKFKSRFLMERARNGIDVVEAELYIDEALRLFPEDGYFLKYRGELLWMRGKCADALEIFADAREKTANGITQLELDKFLEPYVRDTAKTCKMLLDYGQKDGAMQLIALWYRLLPEDMLIRRYYYLARVNVAKTRSEMESILDEITERIEAAADSHADQQEKRTEAYKPAMTRAWERLGYSQELAQIRTDIYFARESDDLEWLAEKAKDCHIRKDKSAQVYKVIGDARRKQGQTDQAFANYRMALQNAGHSYVHTELSRIYLEDLYENGRKTAIYAKAGDAAEYLDQWLGRYGSVEELQALVKELVRN